MVRIRLFVVLFGIVFIGPAHGQTTLTWSGGGSDSNWSDVANWSFNGNPAGVYPNNGQPAAGNTYNAVVNSGNPTLDTNITVVGLTVTNGAGTISGAGNLNVNGLFTWTGGTIAGTGTVALSGGASLDTTNANLFLGQAVNNVSGSTATLSGTNALYSSNGTANWTNQSGSTFTFASDMSLINLGSTGTFTNQSDAIFQKTGGTGVSSVGWIFSNSGTVNATSGTLNFEATNTQSGPVTIDTGATVEFSSATSTWTGTAGSTGAGTISVQSGSVFFNGTNNLATKVSLAGGTIDGTGALTISGPLSWTSGNMGDPSTPGAGTTALTGGASFDTTNANLFLNRTVTNANGSIVTLAGNNGLYSSNTTANWTNQSGSMFSITGNAGILVFSGTGTFTNQSGATFQKIGGANTSNIAWNFSNSGTVNATAGILNFTGTNTQNGAITIGAGATVQFSSSTSTWTGTAGSSGLGALQVQSGSVLFNGTNSLASAVSLTGGTIDGSGALTISGPLSWTSGNMGDPSTPAAGTTALTGGATFDTTNANLFLNRTVTNANGSIVTLVGSNALLSSNTTANWTNQNGSTFSITGGASLSVFSAAGTFTNQSGATFQKTGGANTSNIAWNFSNSGTVNATSGTLNFNGTNTQNGPITIGTGATVQFSTATSTWTGTAGSTGAGTILIQSGSMLFNGTNNLATKVSLTGGTIDGSGALTISGPLSWTSGNMGDPSTPAAGTTTISGGATLDTTTANLFLNRSLTNATGSTATLMGGNALFSSTSNATWTNQSGATFSIVSDASLSPFSSTGTFLNSGTFQKIGGTGTSTIAWNFTNSGTVIADPGTLSFSSSANLTNYSAGILTGGTWQATAGATLDLSASRPITTIAPGTTVTLSGAGSAFADLENHVLINAGNLNILGGRSFTPGGPLTNSGTLTVGQTTGDGSAFNDGVTVTSGGILRGTGAVIPTAGNTVAVNAGGKIMGGQSGAAGALSVALPAGQNLALAGTLNVNMSGTTPPDANGLSSTTSRIALNGGGLALSSASLTLDFSGIGTTGAISNDPNGNGNGFWTNSANYNDAAHDGYVWRVIDLGSGTTGLAPAVTNPIYSSGMFNSFIGTGGPLTLSGGGAAGAVYLSFSPVPEPSSIFLVSAAAAGLAGWSRRRRAKAAI